MSNNPQEPITPNPNPQDASATQALCTQCRASIEPHTPLVICPSCRQWYHMPCWEAQHGCSNPACHGAAPATAHEEHASPLPAANPITTRPRRRWGLMLGIVIFIVLGAAVVILPRLRLAEGRMLMHLAADSGNLTVARALRVCGSAVDIEDDQGITPVLAACATGHLPMVEWLVSQGADLQHQDRNGATALHLAGDPAVITYLLAQDADLQATDQEGNTPLHRACQVGALECAAILVRQGADSTQRNAAGDTPAHLLVADANPMLVDDVTRLRASLRALHAAGMRFDALNEQGETPLMNAYQQNSRGVVEALLASGIPVTTRMKGGATALHLAAFAGDEEFTKLLLEHGAQIDAKDDIGNTPLHYAARKGQEAAAKLLVNSGADIFALNAEHQYPHDVAGLHGHDAVAAYLFPGD